MEPYEEPMVCSQCGEEATKEYRRVTTLEMIRDERDGILNPSYWEWTGGYTHVDGEPLCPVVGDQGYQPGPVVSERLWKLAELDESEPTEEDPDERPAAWRERLV
jgi:hypothetical protein